jgi:hypothetical protein
MFIDQMGTFINRFFPAENRATARRWAIDDVENQVKEWSKGLYMHWRKTTRQHYNVPQEECVEAIYEKDVIKCTAPEVLFSDVKEEWKRGEKLSKTQKTLTIQEDGGAQSISANGSNRLPLWQVVPEDKTIKIISPDGGSGRILGVGQYPGSSDANRTPQLRSLGTLHILHLRVDRLYEMQQYFEGSCQAKKDCSIRTYLRSINKDRSVDNYMTQGYTRSFSSSNYYFKEKGRKEDQWLEESDIAYQFTPTGGTPWIFY